MNTWCRITLLSSGADLNPKLRATLVNSWSCLFKWGNRAGFLEEWAGLCSCWRPREAVPSGSSGCVSTGSSQRTCFLPVRPWRRSRNHGGNSSRRRRSCCTGSSGLTPPLLSPWPLSPPLRSPSWPHRAWVTRMPAVTASSKDLVERQPGSLVLFPGGDEGGNETGSQGVCPANPGHLGHTESPGGRLGPEQLPPSSRETSESYPFVPPPPPFSLFRSGSAEAFPRGNHATLGIRPRRNTPLVLTCQLCCRLLSDLTCPSHLTPSGLSSASKPVRATEQTTLESLTVPF